MTLKDILHISDIEYNEIKNFSFRQLSDPEKAEITVISENEPWLEICCPFVDNTGRYELSEIQMLNLYGFNALAEFFDKALFCLADKGLL